MAPHFQLLLFASSPAIAIAAEAAKIDGVVVDWECRGKTARQAGRDTQINQQTVLDLRNVRRATRSLLICRINGYGPSTPEEVASAIGEGADEILLPMVRNPDEVKRTLDLAAGRTRVGMLIETLDAVVRIEELAHLPVSRAYVGLNDLSIERGTPNLFTAVTDGTIETIRSRIGAPFGFGGLTVPESGTPIPCSLLISEMVRLNCQFSFLRRSFLRDVPKPAFRSAVERIRTAFQHAAQRTEAERTLARQALSDAVMSWR